MTKENLEMEICKAKATIALLKAEMHETTDAEKHLKRIEKLLLKEV